MSTPTLPHEYQGKQVIINSDRVLFNSKTDSVLGFAYKHISFSANGNIHLDTSDNTDSQIVLNSPNIYLGLEQNENFPSEHAVLGDKAEELITKYGGEYIIRGPAHKITEGEYLHGRAVVIAKFESVEQAEAFILSDIYVKEIKPLRDNTGIYDVSVFESP